MKYPSILLGALQSCMKCQSVVEALITSPSVDRDVNFKSSAHTEISIKFIPSVKGLIGIIPGPSEPAHDVNSFLGPLIAELTEFWHGIPLKVQMDSTIMCEQTIRCALLCVACDLPAG